MNQEIRWFDAQEYFPSSDGYYLVLYMIPGVQDPLLTFCWLSVDAGWNMPEGYVVLLFAEVQKPRIDTHI